MDVFGISHSHGFRLRLLIFIYLYGAAVHMNSRPRCQNEHALRQDIHIFQ